MRGCLIYHIKVLSFFLIYYYTIFKAYCMISVNPNAKMLLTTYTYMLHVQKQS